jgi:hypothetical protein
MKHGVIMERLAASAVVARRTAFCICICIFHSSMMWEMGKPHDDHIFAAKSGGRNALS